MKRNYDEIMELVGKTAEITASNTENTAVVLAKLQAQESLLNGLSSTVNNMDTKMSNLENDITQLKMNEEITTTQQETIIVSAKHRVLEIIGDDPLEIKKYMKIFIQKLYTFISHNSCRT